MSSQRRGPDGEGIVSRIRIRKGFLEDCDFGIRSSTWVISGPMRLRDKSVGGKFTNKTTGVRVKCRTDL